MFKQNLIVKLTGLCLVIALFAVIAGCGTPKSPVATEAPKTRTVVDHAGRTVTVPAEINKVFSTSPVGMILMYTLAPEKLVAWNFEIAPENKKFILPQYHNLPDLGGWYANKSCNTEELLKINPDVIISIGVLNESSVSQADQIQQQVGLPVVVVNGELAKMDQAYVLMGDLVGAKERAGELAAYCRKTVDAVAEKAKQIPENKRVRVYYAEGVQGLDTDPKGSQHTEVLDLVGGINIADVPMKGGMGMAAVSLEQVLSWDPDVIITATMGGLGGKEGMIYKTVTTDPKWSTLQAVKNDRVYDIPDKPFNWFDRPPSVNRIIGVKWLANVLYPDVFPCDIKAEMKDFFTKFYHHNLSDQEIEELLVRSKVKQ
ncbi:MAG: ABC transporter substrate-binding protein [Heliobacteriaceae bacterium]|nr:ABC transporter substrate-binding protein [Heliobacteriaceae bacterium]